MTAKIVEAVAKILEGLNKNLSLEELNKEFKASKEFDQQTVSAAFGLVYDRILTKKHNHAVKTNHDNKIRIFSEDEKEVLGFENYNYLLHLKNVGLLDDENLEIILEQIMMFPLETITKEDINWIILVSIVEPDADSMPGSRVLLYSSDTIN